MKATYMSDFNLNVVMSYILAGLVFFCSYHRCSPCLHWIYWNLQKVSVTQLYITKIFKGKRRDFWGMNSFRTFILFLDAVHLQCQKGSLFCTPHCDCSRDWMPSFLCRSGLSLQWSWGGKPRLWAVLPYLIILLSLKSGSSQDVAFLSVEICLLRLQS